jgi:hypothetical protein
MLLGVITMSSRMAAAVHYNACNCVYLGFYTHANAVVYYVDNYLIYRFTLSAGHKRSVIAIIHYSVCEKLKCRSIFIQHAL